MHATVHHGLTTFTASLLVSCRHDDTKLDANLCVLPSQCMPLLSLHCIPAMHPCNECSTHAVSRRDHLHH